MSSFPIDAVRAVFPALADESVVFMDNPAGTQVPRRVIDAVSCAMVDAASNLGGYFPQSRAADATWLAAHEAMADLLGAASFREVVVAQSMTALTFLMSRTLGRDWRAGDEIIVTRMDHEGDVSPWLQLAEEKGLTVRWLPFDRDSWRIEPEALAGLLSDRTRLLALNYASNLTGSVNDVVTLSAMAKAAGALVWVDAVQLAPHRAPAVHTLGCDFLVCSSYKFYGPHLGVLWGREELLAALRPYKCRCSSDDLPERFELGTPQTELLAGLAATVEHFDWLGGEVGASGDRGTRIAAAYEAMTGHETTLTRRLLDGLTAIDGVSVQGIVQSNRDTDRVPTVSFTHESVAPAVIAERLAADGICVWSGHNYALEVVRHLGIDEASGVLRIGLAQYNTADEVERVLERLMAVLG